MKKSIYYYLVATSLLLHLSSLKTTNNVVFIQALSLPNNDSGNNDLTRTLSDRFRCTCPASLSSIRLFDPSLVVNENETNENNVIWAAVHRSNQNQPSVFIRDEFLNAMKAAIEPVSSSSSQNLNDNNNNNKSSWSSLLETPESKQVPVAVACLRPAASTNSDGCYVLDTLRCVLKKESMDTSCDGGSEHCEAISVAIDSLILHHLSSSSNKNGKDKIRFEQAIRAKATLISGKLLEMRGFEPITTLQNDMTTHISSLDACLEKYAERSVNTVVAKSPGAQQRALSIVSCLARLDRDADFQAAAAARALARKDQENNGKDDYDPFSSITGRFI